MNEIQRIILEIWELESKWDEMHDPQFTWYGNMTFRKLHTLEEMQDSIRLSDRIRKSKQELRGKIGLLKYIWFFHAPLSFYESLNPRE